MTVSSPLSQQTTFAKKADNPVRKIVEDPRLKKLIQSSKSLEKPLIPLSIGDPTVFKNLKAPQFFLDKICEATQDVANHGYLPSTGKLEARQAIAEKYSYKNNKLSADDVIISSGCSGALEILFKALLNPSSAATQRKILLPSPGFPLYETLLDAYDIPFEKYNLIEENGWECDLEELERKMNNDRSICSVLITNPSNPTGSVFKRQHLMDVLKVCNKWGVTVVADEIYGDLTFGESKFYPIASLAKTEHFDVNVISIGGIAKELLVPGFRLGWICFYLNTDHKFIKDGALRLSMLILGANSLIQAALPSVLKQSKELDVFSSELRKTLHANGKLVQERFNEMRNRRGERVFRVSTCEGAMYCFVKILEKRPEKKRQKKCESVSVEFMEELLAKEQVFVLPGKPFGDNADDCFRVTLTPPKHILEEALNRIENFVQN